MNCSGKIAFIAGYKYQLAQDWWIDTPIRNQACRIEPYLELRSDGRLLVYSGYAWDGASGPAIDTRSIMRGSLVHDALYQLLRAGKLPQRCRAMADKILRDICRQDGMPFWRAWYAWGAVRVFAGKFARHQTPKIEEAP